MFSLVFSLFVGVAIVVATLVLDLVLAKLGALDSVNQLISDISPVADGGRPRAPVLTTGRIVGGAVLIAAVDVVLLTALATLSTFLYNLCASFTGGIEVTLGEQD